MKLATPIGALSGNNLQVNLPTVVSMTAVGCPACAHSEAENTQTAATIAIRFMAKAPHLELVMLETGLYRGRASAIPKPHHSRSALAAEAAPEGVVKDGIAETVPRYESRLVGRCWNPISAHQPLPRIQNCTTTHTTSPPASPGSPAPLRGTPAAGFRPESYECPPRCNRDRR